MVELTFMPIPGLLTYSGLGKKEYNTFEVPGRGDNMERLLGRAVNNTVSLTFEAMPGERILVDQYWRLKLKFGLSYQIFGYGNPPPPVDVGVAVDCQIISLEYADGGRNSDAPVVLSLEILIGEWIV